MRVFLMLIFVSGTLALAACSNTADGIGRDVEKAGEKIQKTF